MMGGRMTKKMRLGLNSRIDFSSSEAKRIKRGKQQREAQRMNG
jgi:hypothetical protein